MRGIFGFGQDLIANLNGVPLSETFENLDTLVWEVNSSVPLSQNNV